MIIVTIILTIIAGIVGWKTLDEGYEGWGITALIGAVVFGIIDMLLVIAIILHGTDMVTIDKKINMYQEENTKIEEQMTTIVNNYKGYEKEIISNIAEMEVLIIKFPELKTSELVKTQMNVYIKNNEKIKELKEKQIDTKIIKWLLYFGS